MSTILRRSFVSPAGQISTLPWCEQSPAPETSIISSNLRLLNANGYLTINSQVPTLIEDPRSVSVLGAP
jgi:hypothetical protein